MNNSKKKCSRILFFLFFLQLSDDAIFHLNKTMNIVFGIVLKHIWSMKLNTSLAQNMHNTELNNNSKNC